MSQQELRPAEQVEVVSVRLGRDQNKKQIIVVTLRYADLSTDDIFMHIDNAHRLRGDINDILSAIDYRPPVVVTDSPLRGRIQRKRKE